MELNIDAVMVTMKNFNADFAQTQFKLVCLSNEIKQKKKKFK